MFKVSLTLCSIKLSKKMFRNESEKKESQISFVYIYITMFELEFKDRRGKNFVLSYG